MTKSEYIKIRDDLLHQWAKWKISDHQVDVGLNAIGAFDDDSNCNNGAKNEEKI